MPNILFFSPTTGAVTDYKLSVDEQPYLGRTDVLFQPTLPDCPRQFWIVSGGSVREMTEAEKTSFYPPHVPSFDEKLLALTEGGYLDETTGIRLKATDREIAERWTPMATGIQTQLARGQITESTNKVLLDYDGAPKVLTAGVALDVLGRLTAWFEQRFMEAAQ